MTAYRSRKIWLGVGAAAFVASTTASADEPTSYKLIEMAQATATHDHGANPAHAGEGGEGGESGGASGASLPAIIKFRRDIGLIRGHLLVGDELVQQGREVLVGAPDFAVDFIVRFAQRNDLVVVAESYRLSV